MARYAAARYEHMARYFSGVVSRLCIPSLHAVVTVLFHARLNIQEMTDIGGNGTVTQERTEMGGNGTVTQEMTEMGGNGTVTHGP